VRRSMSEMRDVGHAVRFDTLPRRASPANSA
jgi:hypothetical protein